MHTRLHASIALALIGLSTLAVTHQAKACGLPLVQAANGKWMVVAPPKGLSTAAARAMMAADAPASMRAYHNPLQFLEPITGLYEETLTSQGNPPDSAIPNGAVADHGYSVWHADGSEIMNSGRPAGDSNFCLGTWARTGKRTYMLNHFTLAWTQTVSNTPDLGTPPGLPPPFVNNEFVGPGNIRETITLSPDGNSFTGTFTITQYMGETGQVVPGFPVSGVINGTRLTINSPVTY